MRRVVGLLLLIFGLSLFLTSFRNLPIPQFVTFSKEFDIFHAISGGMTVILLVIHLWLNRKPFFRYFSKLGWWWILLGLGFLSVIWGGVIITLSLIEK